MKFRKKPVVIDAFHFGYDNFVPEWFRIAEGNGRLREYAGEVKINTPEGVMTASFGDWIIKGVAGEIYPCKAAIFDATYEAVE